MIIFLYGPDSFRAGRKLKEIVESYKIKHRSGLNFRQLEWQPESLGELKEALSSVSMFAEKKLIVIRDACQSGGQSDLIQVLQESGRGDDNIIVFFEQKIPEKSELYAWLLKKVALKEEFALLEGAKLANWVRKEFQKQGNGVTSGALQKFLASVGSDLWRAENEIAKLARFKKEGPIGEKDVDLLVRANLDPNIFATIDALAGRNKDQAFRMLHRHLRDGENEIYLLTMFVRQFRNLILIKDLCENGFPAAALAKKTGLHPFVVKKTIQQSKNFSSRVLKVIYGKLLDLDIAIKRGRVSPEAALDLIVAEIAS